MDKGISIIIPAWNRPDMLLKCLTNLKQRTSYQPREVIVVDDGSTITGNVSYEQMKNDGLLDKIVQLEKHDKFRLTNFAYSEGLRVSNPEFAYVQFGADDIIFRTNWVQVLIDMLESDWAKKNNVKIVSGFNTWSIPGDYEKMRRYLNEMYKSEDGKVEGYVTEWGGAWFFRRDFFNEIGGMANNLKNNPDPNINYESIMYYKATEFGFRWGATVESYIQTMAPPNSSTLGNYHYGTDGKPVNDARHCNGIAIGINWKDE